MPQTIHFISIGGSATHNLALALQQQGFIVTGSDDEIHEPSRTRLAQRGLLPAETGWFPANIHVSLDAVIVGMHTHKDNPELAKAQELGLPICSYPEYIYQQSRQKQRVVIAGSHGKTTITSVILHVLKYYHRTFDYLIGAQIDGFETMAQLTTDAPIIIIEGDEHASSSIDPRPKFLHYQPHIALISGIAWDHVNIYPTWDEYVDQFELLAEGMPKAGILIFDETDDMLDVIGQKERADITKIPYEAHPSEIINGRTCLITKQKAKIPVLLFGEHNMKNMAGALTVLDRIGITEAQFYEAIPTFKGAERRLEKVAEGPGASVGKPHSAQHGSTNRILFRDFAHSPSKVEATTEAVKHQYSGQKLLAAVELHTFSGLSRAFLDQYKGCLDAADEAVVYVNTQPFATERLEPITPDDVIVAFDRPNLRVFTNTAELQAHLLSQRDAAEIFLLMSSGTFDGMELDILAEKLITGV